VRSVRWQYSNVESRSSPRMGSRRDAKAGPDIFLLIIETIDAGGIDQSVTFLFELNAPHQTKGNGGMAD